jgi:hypothetical protein
MHDAMQGINLGIAPHACGNTSFELANSGTQAQLAANLQEQWYDFKNFCKRRRIQCNLPQLTPLRVCRNAGTTYPMLKAKAYNTTMFTIYLAEKRLERAELLPGNPWAEPRATCMWALAEVFCLMNVGGRFLATVSAAGFSTLDNHFYASVP